MAAKLTSFVRRRPALAAVVAAALLVWLWVSLPLALGSRTLSFRDVFNVHLPLKAFGAEQLHQGRVTALDPNRALGQPFRGNPQALAFYPDNLLYLVLPFWSAFNVHYALHWLLAGPAFFLLARRLGQSSAAALLAALTYAGSGWALTCLSFYHLVVVVAWWPLVMAAALEGGRRGIALGAGACGLALLGGAPVAAALGLVPLVLVAITRHGIRRGLGVCVAIVGLGLALALPQLVATLRILPFTARGSLGVAPSEVGLYALHPLRLAELVLPLPFGEPGDLGLRRYWAADILPRVPLILSLYCGVVAFALALVAARRRARWSALAAAGWLLAWLGGELGAVLAAVSGGLFRYPEKFLFWPALALPLMAGWGLEVVLASPRRWFRPCGLAALWALGSALALWLLRGRVVVWLLPHLRSGSLPGTAPTVVAMCFLQLLALAALLGLAAWCLRRRSHAGLVAVQLLALLQLAPLVMSEPTEPYRQPPEWLERLGERPAVVPATVGSPLGPSSPRYRMGDTSVFAQHRLLAADLDPVPGVLYGASYPLALDPDGLFSPLSVALLRRLPQLGPAAQLTWLRLLGVEGLVVAGEVPWQGLEPVQRVERFGVPTWLLRVDSPAPEAWWPRQTRVVETPARALAAISERSDLVSVAVVPRPLTHRPGGEVRLRQAEPDRLELETDGLGGLVVVQRAYQELFEASSPAGRVAVLPVNLTLLGLVVPPGPQRIVVSVPWWPEVTAAVMAVLVLGGVLWLGWRQ